ncbi:MAG TPA: DUF2950 domain-containing protein [Burkholderiales bacterium]|nr:DUF2950 domain-containing protein [Burkholderiales bacterium]
MRRIGLSILAAALLLAAAAHPACAADGAKQKSFATPEEAAKQLAAAAKSGDSRALLEILGPDARAIIASGDPIEDSQSRARFARAYDEANRLERSGDTKAILSVGRDDWPFPIPIVKDAAGWRFDTKQGQDEILNRRIGRNERHAVQAALAYVDAQREYYLRNPQGDKLLHYAQKFLSTNGRRDGLYWRARAAEPPSPLGPVFAAARAEGYGKDSSGKPYPYHGYFYRILKGQGPDARGGAYDYVVQGQMIGGFALIAYPAAYGNSGVMSFMVNHDGTVYEKDLGPETGRIAPKMAKFNPDKSWRPL